MTVLAVWSQACGGKSGTTGEGDPAQQGSADTGPPAAPGQIGAGSPLSDDAFKRLADAPDGLDMSVSDGKQGAPAADRSKLAPATKLGDADAAAVLARTKAIATDPGDAKAFALRPASQPAPRTGTTTVATFPPPLGGAPPPAPAAAAKELRVLRYLPEGKVPLAPELSVTFSEPMVAVTSQDDAAKTTPVTLAPQPKGKWRWIGTRTVLFDPEVRFPQATTYTVEIPAGTKAAGGNALAKATKFTFETPPPSLISHYPYPDAATYLDTPVFLLFDQKIDAAAVLAKVKLASGKGAATLQLLDEAEITKLAAGKRPDHVQLAALVEGAKRNEQAGRWLAFRATAPLAADTAFRLDVPAGTPSAEGPNVTKANQGFGFRTYPPLRIVRAECGWDGNCPPGESFIVEMNNPLDAEKLEDKQVAISPDVPNVKIIASGTVLSVTGATKARTTYKVTISDKLADQFGQQLGKSELRTFRVGDAEPTFFGPEGTVVLDPAAKKRTLDFFTLNYDALKVKLYKVTAGDYDAWRTWYEQRWNHDRPPPVPGTLAYAGTVKTRPVREELVETQVDLSPALSKDGLGHVIAFVEPSPWRFDGPPPQHVAWVQATQLGLSAHLDAEQLVGFATELATGAAARDVRLELRPFGATATTDAQGLGTITLTDAGKKGVHHLVATRGDDVAILSEDYYNAGGTWHKQTRAPTLAWYVVDDRKMYKPGEQVALKGWLRKVEHAKHGDVGSVKGIVDALEYKVYDSRRNEIGKGTAKVSSVGGFDTTFTLPKTPNLGYATVELEAKPPGGDTWKAMPYNRYAHTFRVEEFRRPEFEVAAQAGQGPFLVGGGGDVTVTAKYFAGGPLAGAPASWYVTAAQTSFTPPNRDDYTFGSWTPWWGGYDLDAGYGYRRGYRGYSGYKPPKTWQLPSKTDATGAHVLHMDWKSIKPAMPMSVTATASVTDVNRQTWTSAATMIVHPSTAYVGLRARRPFVEKGTPFDLDVIGVDLDGKPLVGANIEVVAARQDWKFEKGQYVRVEADRTSCSVVAAAKPSGCKFPAKEGGEYKVTATIVDAKGRPNTTTMSFWVSGGDEPPAREVTRERVKIIPDKKEYAAGNTAELLVQAPFYPAEALVTWRRSGIVKTERVAFTGPTKIVTVPIADAMVPNLTVQVDLVGTAPRADDKGVADPKLPRRVAYASGAINLPVPPKQRTLAVGVAPGAAKLAPGESTKIAVTVADAAGAPVADAEVAVIVVDEAILALSSYTFPSPIDLFYGARGPDARDYHSRQFVRLARPEAAGLAAGPPPPPPPADPSTGIGTGQGYGVGAGFGSGNAAAPAQAQPRAAAEKSEAKADVTRATNKPMEADKNFGGLDGLADGDRANASSQAIAVRSNFNPLAAFAPAVRTDGAGKATVEVKVPDNLTRYRIVAVATAGEKQFGKGESAVTARLPLMVRPSPPRFLNFGDTFRLPVVVQNQTDSAMTVRLAARTTNATLTDGAGREVTVPANDRVEVRFPAAAELAGTARFQLVGQSGAYSDAAEVALPVWTPATTEAFATYGTLDGTGDEAVMKQKVALPGKVVTQFGGLEVTTSSTNLQALTDALLYLVRYPYECAEQRSSRILAIAALRDVLTAFKTRDMPTAAELDTSIKADLERLSQMQNYDGGFAFWDRGRPSDPYLTVYVASALAQAGKKGLPVLAGLLDRSKPYLANIEARYPWWYGQDIRRTISAYALYVRKSYGDLDVAKAKRLLAEAGGPAGLSMEAVGWLLGTMAGHAGAAGERAQLVRHALNKVSETAGAANFTTGYGDGAYLLLASNHRVDAIMLDALIQEDEKLDLIPKLVTGMLAHRKAGRWLNTQENTFALLAMDRYFQTYEKATPDFIAKVWLGNDYAGEKAFKGRSTDYFAIPIPMKDVAAHDKQDLTIQKDGTGRLYYRIGMSYAPASLQLEPADHGFVVQRTYEAVDDAKDVTRDKDGTWRVKAGARVRVKLAMVNENRRYHVALVDPMPAGFEAMNPALAVTGPIPQDPNEQKSRGAYWWWQSTWYEHQNLRDERVEAFASLLWEGVHAYTYVARATTPGNFIVPPTKAEEMYMPETFGRSSTDRVIVE
ncbi:MAG: Ig-like domain-containing protein [Deltaproteobacteria bacterium]|nr:Ig-like domain-containing protein [Deltaproteobacteria bacterium]